MSEGTTTQAGQSRSPRFIQGELAFPEPSLVLGIDSFPEVSLPSLSEAVVSRCATEVHELGISVVSLKDVFGSQMRAFEFDQFEELVSRAPLEEISNDYIRFRRAIIFPDKAQAMTGTKPEPFFFFQQAPIQELFQAVLETPRVELEIIQRNQMVRGDFMPKHTDRAQSEQFELTAVLHLRGEYTGGAFWCLDKQEREHFLKPEPGTLVLLEGDTLHSVEKVRSGTRNTVVAVMSGVPPRDVEHAVA